MDKIDHKIISILQEDAEITNAALAERVYLAPSSCLRRVQRLKKDGVILRKVAVIDDRVLGRSLKAIVEVDLDRHGVHAREAFHQRLSSEVAVVQAYGISGDADVVLMMKLRDMEEYQAVCERLFDHDKNVLRFRTSFVMSTIKD